MQKEDWFASRLQGFGVIGIAAFALIAAGNLLLAPLGALMVLAWAWRARIPWPALGFRRSSNWLILVTAAFFAGILLKLVQKAILMPLIGAPAINPHFQFVVGNPAALAKMLVAGAVIGGIGEEIFYRGYLFERLGRLWGQGFVAKGAMIGLTTVIFAMVHLDDQGIPGAQQAAFTGLVFATIYALTGRLWLSMVVHGVYNMTAFVIIYLNLETAIGHAVFG